MRKLLNPKWLFLTNTLPIAILLFLEWNELKIIKSLLDEQSIFLWNSLAIALIILAVCNMAYAAIQMKRKKRIDLTYSIVSFLVYTIYIYCYYNHSSDIIPSSIPDWMISGNILMYVGSFLMPTLIHSLFAAVVILTPNVKSEVAWKNLATAIAIPVIFYTFGILVSRMWNGSSFGEDAFIFFMIVITTLFLFFLLRFVYILISKKKLYDFKLIWDIPIAFILPIIGLFVNDIMFNHMFGDFSSPWFYIITVVNTVFLCLPSPKNKKLRLLLFGGRCVTFIYTLYFFLIMLPFLPFSVIAIIIFGAGFLMLTPMMLFPLHLNELVKDFNALKRVYKKRIIYLTAIAGLLVLPVATTVSYMYDRIMLDKTLEYIYSPDYTKEYNLSTSSVNRMLNTIDYRARGDMFFYKSTPFLSSYYKWLVLDNLNLSESKKDMMRDLFNGSGYNHNNRNRNTSRRANDTVDIKITDIKHHSEYNTEKKEWISWVDLAIHNGDTQLWNAEYKTNIDLPVGCWISDYYLYVGDVKEMGILAEKRAATWVFDQIRSVNRDPGLLRYLQGNKVEFKVFPFQKQETRFTGIEFIHKDPVQITIDGHILKLGSEKIQKQVSYNSKIKTKDITYISAEDKAKLESVSRKPYYHFIVDVSANWNDPNFSWYNYNNSRSTIPSDTIYKNKSKYTNAIKNFLDKNPAEADKRDSKISYVNTYISEATLNTDWEKELLNKEFQGGFFLDRAIKKILVGSYTRTDNSYPVIVVFSDDINKAILNYDFGDLQFTYPESNLFYSVQNDTIRSHTFTGGAQVISNNVDSILTHTVKAWPNPANPTAYLPDDDKPSVILNTRNKTSDITQTDIKKKDWESGLQMQAQWMLQVLYPDTADQEWLTLIQNSFKSGIMTPLTAYIVVENEAQKAILKKKQEEALSGNRSLDLSDDTQRMSEPDLFIIALLFGLFIFYYKRKKKRSIIDQ